MGYHTNNAMVIGVNPTTLHLKKLIDSNPVLGFKFIGFVADHNPENIELLGDTNQLADLLDDHQIEMLFVSFSIASGIPNYKEYLRLCNKKGVRMRFIPENQNFLKCKANLESVGSLVLINPQEIPLDNIYGRMMKRTFDVLFSSIFILLIFSWLLPILGLLIRISSKGPILFVQKRTGVNNKTFNCYKFRSMYVNENANSLQATYNDSRITPVGKFMRSTNLDELPQFINVFLGQMSTVGPRPHMLEHTLKYSDLIEQYLVRHYVKPGITGWAQVNGFRGETDELWKMEKRVEYDMEYIRTWSFWRDLKIVFKTVFDKKTYINAG